MRRILLSIGVLVALSAVVMPSVQSQSDPTKKAATAVESEKNENNAQPKADRSTDEATIRANVAQFVKAYNAGDAKAVASLFIPDGRIEDKDGNESTGQKAIARTFADLFKNMPKKQIEVFVDSIRFIGPDLAIEVGTTKEILFPNEAPEYDRYTVIHVKRDGKWQMALARDEEGLTSTGHEQLQPLAWLVGDWVDDGGGTVVLSSCRWSDDGNFLLQEFRLEINEREAMNVSQRIAWDPAAQRIRSWVFDSEGGFGESVWERNGSTWIINTTGVRPDGTTGSALNYLIPKGKDGYVWRSTERVVANEVQPSVEVRVVRKPPQPKK